MKKELNRWSSQGLGREATCSGPCGHMEELGFLQAFRLLSPVYFWSLTLLQVTYDGKERAIPALEPLLPLPFSPIPSRDHIHALWLFLSHWILAAWWGRWLVIPILQKQKWDSEKLSDLHRVAQLLSDRAGQSGPGYSFLPVLSFLVMFIRV